MVPVIFLVREQVGFSFSVASGSGLTRHTQRDFGRRRLSRALRDLAIGCQTMVDTLEQVQVCFANRIPLLIEGEPGTGKTQLVASLHADLGNIPSQLIRQAIRIRPLLLPDKLVTKIMACQVRVFLHGLSGQLESDRGR